MKRFYRVSNTETNQGLWYDMEGNFTGLIHDKFDFCTNNELPMPYDEELVGWISATDTLEDLFNWFTKDDIKKLEEFGYKICVFEASEVKQYKNHLVINQASSKFLKFIDIKTILRFE